MMMYAFSPVHPCARRLPADLFQVKALHISAPEQVVSCLSILLTKKLLFMIRTFIVNFPQFSPGCSPSSRPFPCNFTNLHPQHFGCSSMNCELFLFPSLSLCTMIGSLMLIDVDLFTTEGCGSTDSQQLLTRVPQRVNIKQKRCSCRTMIRTVRVKSRAVQAKNSSSDASSLCCVGHCPMLHIGMMDQSRLTVQMNVLGLGSTTPQWFVS